MISCTRK